MARLFLGVDGGQSSTTAVVGDETGHVLGVGTGGPCNHVKAPEGAAKLKRTVLECVGRACENAGLDFTSMVFDSACFGMSGGPSDKGTLLREIIRAERYNVTDDAVIALSGALGGRPGVVTIAGTGSIAYGRDSSGRSARAGGWGYIFGDEGGAFDIVRMALQAALRFEEGWGGETKLHRILLEQTSADSANDLLHRFYTVDWPRSRVAALAPLIDTAAEAGDAVAISIIQKAARQLADMALAVWTILAEQESPLGFSYFGGVFRSGMLLGHFRSNIETQENRRVEQPAFDSATGALLEAYRLSGILPNIDNLLTSKI